VPEESAGSWLLTPRIGLAKVIYVDDDAPLLGDGQSWETAFRFLQEGLAFAVAGDEIRAAQGVYRPVSRSGSFKPFAGGMLVGGYAGAGSVNPNTRDFKLYRTILSGDLKEDDTPITDPCELNKAPGRDDNCYR